MERQKVLDSDNWDNDTIQIQRALSRMELGESNYQNTLLGNDVPDTYLQRELYNSALQRSRDEVDKLFTPEKLEALEKMVMESEVVLFHASAADEDFPPTATTGFSDSIKSIIREYENMSPEDRRKLCMRYG